MQQEYIKVTVVWEVPRSYGRRERWWENNDSTVWNRLFNDKGYCTSINVQEMNPSTKGRFDFLKRIFI